MPRVKPHAKLHCSLGNHTKTASMYADNDMLALYARILITATERYADRHGNSFNVHRSEICQLTGKGRRDVAAKSLERLADVSPISASPYGDMWVIHVPNFLTKQGFNPKKGDRIEDPPTPAPTPTPSPKPSKLPPPSASGLALSGILKRGILNVTGWNCDLPKAECPVSWARVIDEMLAKGRTHERIKDAIVWLYTENRDMDPNETFTIQGAIGLKKKFDRVEAGMQRGKPSSKHLAREKREQEEADQRRREREAVTRERSTAGGVMAGDVLKGMKLGGG